MRRQSKVDVLPVQSLGGVLTFPGLGRSAVVAGASLRRYRAAVEAEFYIPFYAAQSDGIEFDVFPFNDENPPAKLPEGPQTVVLVPAQNYPFPPYLRVLRGEVRDTAGPVANVEVTRAITERVLSDGQGVYALPLRFSPNKGAVIIDAIDHRANRHGQITVSLPADLGKFNLITAPASSASAAGCGAGQTNRTVENFISSSAVPAMPPTSIRRRRWRLPMGRGAAPGGFCSASCNGILTPPSRSSTTLR